MDISLDWYRAFLAAAECGSITRAAGELYVSQPALSQTIRQLEAALHCALFRRTPKGVILTAEGRALLPFAREGIARLRHGERSVRALTSLEDGEIAIGASDMTLEFFLLPRLEQFHRLYPGVRVSITNGPTPETLRRLEAGTIDFGVVSEPADFPGAIPLRAIEDIFIAHPDDAPECPLSLPELAARPLVLLEKGTSTRRYIDAFLAENGVRPAPAFELATSSLIVQFARRGLGVGCVVRDFAEAALSEGAVVQVETDPPIPPRRFLLAARGVPASKAAEALLLLLVP
jgi:DNA-binding transcriptional LysR family regulator